MTHIKFKFSVDLLNTFNEFSSCQISLNRMNGDKTALMGCEEVACLLSADDQQVELTYTVDLSDVTT
jgi:hypothetical protein